MPATSVTNRVFALNQGVLGWVTRCVDRSRQHSPHISLIISTLNIVKYLNSIIFRPKCDDKICLIGLNLFDFQTFVMELIEILANFFAP